MDFNLLASLSCIQLIFDIEEMHLNVQNLSNETCRFNNLLISVYSPQMVP